MMLNIYCMTYSVHRDTAIFLPPPLTEFSSAVDRFSCKPSIQQREQCSFPPVSYRVLTLELPSSANLGEIRTTLTFDKDVSLTQTRASRRNGSCKSTPALIRQGQGSASEFGGSTVISGFSCSQNVAKWASPTLSVFDYP
jgi:hypothetical protein